MKFACALLVLAVVFVFSACEKSDFDFYQKKETAQQETQGAQVKDGEPANLPPPDISTINAGTIVISSADKTANITVEIAKTEQERTTGLSNRASLPKNFGMWFIFPADVTDKFWMKDTLIPLDLIYVDSGMKIIDIIEHAVPQSTDLLESKHPYRYVLEVNAGVVAENNIKSGDKVEFRIGSK